MTFIEIVGGAFFFTELCKTLLPWTFKPWSKMLLALGAGLVLAWCVTDSLQDVLVAGVGAAGLAAMVHRTHRWMGSVGDVARISVVQAAGRRPIR